MTVQTYSVGIVYDPRYHTWESWTSLMCELYAANQLEINCPESEWKLWANGLKSIDIFTNEGLPGPDAFPNWQEWAQEAINVLDNLVQN